MSCFLLGKIIGSYKIIEIISSRICIVEKAHVSLEVKKELYALKILSLSNPFHLSLKDEYILYQEWHSSSFSHNNNNTSRRVQVLLPFSYYYTKDEQYEYMVLDLLGDSIQEHRDLFYHNYPLTNDLYQSLCDVMQKLHRMNYNHGDLKLEHLLFPFRTKINYSSSSHSESIVLYLIDFGLCKWNYNVTLKQSYSFVGNLLFSSVSFSKTEYNITLSKEVESIYYLCYYLYHNSLLWIHDVEWLTNLSLGRTTKTTKYLFQQINNKKQSLLLLLSLKNKQTISQSSFLS